MSFPTRSEVAPWSDPTGLSDPSGGSSAPADGGAGTSVESRRELARRCWFEGRRPEAAEHYAQILKMRGRDAEALGQLAGFHLERSEFKTAAALLKVLLSVDPGNCTARFQARALMALKEVHGTPASKLAEFYERIAQPEDGSAALGLRRDLIPCLIEMNGDQIWVPGDLLRFLWHTVRKPCKAAIPSFLAETEHYVWVKERLSPGDAVLDIGSNLGIFATMMGARVGPSGRVFAFEPSPRIASDLRRVLTLNELSQVTVVEAAVSDRKGEAVFCEIEEGDVRRESSHLSDPQIDRALGGLQQKTVTVPTLSVDDFAAEHGLRPALMKIDVEGAEFLVLAGARRTIGAHKPKLAIEIHPDPRVFDHARLASYLREFGYDFKHEGKTYYCW